MTNVNSKSDGKGSRRKENNKVKTLQAFIEELQGGIEKL